MTSRPTAHGALGLLTAALVAATSAACGPAFEPPTRLNSPRVLAIKSEPVSPAPGETTTLSVLTYTPNDIPLFYDWSWCPVAPGPGMPCPVSEADLAALLGMPVSLHLGTAATAMFEHNIPPDLLRTLCAGMPGFPATDCTQGFPIQVRLTICTDSDTANCHGAAVFVEAVRPLRLYLAPPDTTNANANPTISGLHALLAGVDPPGADLTMTPYPTLTRKKETVITADLHTDADSELYLGKDDMDKTAMVHERLTLSWFVESGDISSQRTSYIFDKVTGEKSDRLKWTPAYKKDEKDSLRSDTNVSRIIVVIHDDREGVAWISGVAQLVEETAP